MHHSRYRLRGMKMSPDARALQDMKRLGRALGCSIWPEYGPVGHCPWQAGGRICLPNQKPVEYYFRARGTHWSMEFRPDDFPALVQTVRRRYSDTQYMAGWMTFDEALDFIAEAILLWRKGNGKIAPEEYDISDRKESINN